MREFLTVEANLRCAMRFFGEATGGGEVVRLEPSDASLKIPHMGWNELRIAAPHPVLNGIDEGAHAYFVHSFELRAREHVLATTDYGGAVARNQVGVPSVVPYHPQKLETGSEVLVIESWRRRGQQSASVPGR